MESKDSIVLLVCGGWHVPRSYSKLSEQLELAGYDVHVPALPSVSGSRPPNADLYSDTETVRSVAKELVSAGHEIVVLMHSYGGQVGTNALHGLSLETRRKEGLTGGVSNLIYLTAYALPEGKAMIDAVRHFDHEALMPLAFDFTDDMSCVSRDPRTLLVGETGLPASEVDDYIATFVRWNGQAMYQPLTTSRAAWRDIPVTYIHTTKDMTVPFVYQEWCVEQMEREGVEVQIAMLETGHCASFTAAKKVADIVDQLTKGTVRSASGGNSKATNTGEVRDAILNVVGSE
ncbi:alpha/beta-hydrolase [Ophiobolus disseminans]|uniref:Alpha/beta-hydrolase n=1 Tax=Ophiobolus disseminans TaxID=1469910 RepID=A0A6A6ZHT4_9PLEO|nr:alpha/beta-hydrolase [Ophiobolus disseminans]